MTDDSTRHRLARLSTGVPGLDVVLGGGLVDTGLYLVQGVTGSGKTILASQIAFSAVRRGKRALVITLIAESHGKLLEHLRAFDFFDEGAIADRYVLLSGFNELVERGFDGLLQLVTRAVHEQQPALLVLEGFGSIRTYGTDARALGRFLHALNTLATTVRCTTLVLAPVASARKHPEHSLVDGLIELSRVSRGLRRAREIEVHKMRGGAHLTGRHPFSIRDEGVRVHPRLETVLVARAEEPGEEEGRASTGVATLDAMVGGGLMRGSATSVLGAPGVGKTLLGLSFLDAGAAAGERGVYFGFHEARERILENAERVGLALRSWCAQGLVELAWQAPLEIIVDEVAERIDDLVVRHRARRLFIDGLEGFAQAAMHPERLPTFLTALTVRLRARGVTTLLSEELPLLGPATDRQTMSLSALVENVLLLRYFESEGELRRLMVVLKLRASGFDPGIREFRITGDGIALGNKVTGTPDLFGGLMQMQAGRNPASPATDAG